MKIKVVALVLVDKFAIDQFSSSVQKCWEKSSWNSTKPETLTETFGQFWNSNFSSNYFKICWELDKTKNTKVVDRALRYKFSFGQNLSSVQNSSEKSSGKSPKLKP